MYTIGIDVGGTKLAYGLFKDDVLVKKALEPSLPHLSCYDMLSSMKEHIFALMEQNGVEKDQVKSVGVVIPGHVRQDTGVAVSCSNLPTWSGQPVLAHLKELTDLPVILDNDANAAALAENRLGAGKGTTHMLYITISTGVGGGIILDSKLYRGKRGFAGEIGHTLIDTTSPNVCGCGQSGCAEAVASGTGIAKYALLQLDRGVPSILPQLAKEGPITARTVAKGYEMGDALCIETISYAADRLGRLLASLYQLFDFQRAVYGGGTAKIAPLVEGMKEAFARYCPMSRVPGCEMDIVPAYFGDDVGIIGAGLLTE